MINRRLQAQNPRIRHQSPRGLQPNGPTHTRRNPDTPALIPSNRHIHRAGGHETSAAAAGPAAGVPLCVEVVHGPGGGGVGVALHAGVFAGGFAGDGGAGVEDAGGDGGVDGGGPGDGGGAVGAADAGEGDVVF